MYYRPVKAAPKLQDRFVSPIKAMIDENPSFGYRTVAHLLGFNKNTVQSPDFYNHRRPHQALNMRTPAEAFALAA